MKDTLILMSSYKHSEGRGVEWWIIILEEAGSVNTRTCPRLWKCLTVREGLVTMNDHVCSLCSRSSQTCSWGCLWALYDEEQAAMLMCFAIVEAHEHCGGVHAEDGKRPMFVCAQAAYVCAQAAGVHAHQRLWRGHWDVWSK